MAPKDLCLLLLLQDPVCNPKPSMSQIVTHTLQISPFRHVMISILINLINLVFFPSSYYKAVLGSIPEAGSKLLLQYSKCTIKSFMVPLRAPMPALGLLPWHRASVSKNGCHIANCSITASWQSRFGGRGRAAAQDWAALLSQITGPSSSGLSVLYCWGAASWCFFPPQSYLKISFHVQSRCFSTVLQLYNIYDGLHSGC